MRNKKHMIFIIVLILAAVLLIAACGASEGNKDDVPVSGGGEDVQAPVGPQIPDDPQISDDENKDVPGDDEPGSEPVAPAPGGDALTTDAIIWPGSVDDDPNPPATGDDKSAWGIPDVIDTRVKDDGDVLALVNKYHAVSMDYEPVDMVTIDNKYGTYTDMRMKKVAYEAYKKMYADAKDLGFDLKLCSTMRSYDTQKTLFNNSLANRGRETTNVRSAYPGRSEHHTGFALDVTSASMGWGLTQDFINYPDGQWIDEHCHEYGFIIRYPKDKTDITGYAYEPWHLRYVGLDVAAYIKANDLTLEEYLGKVPQ